MVFDLNGIFCHCVPRSREMVTVPTWIMQDRAPDKLPAFVGPKVVLPRLGYKLFWEKMSQMFHVCIWSSMRRSTVRLLVQYLFDELPKPSLVLGQEDCTTYKDIWNNELRNPLKPESVMYFKNLLRAFWWPPQSFDSGRMRATSSNTILVDDSPYKSCCNPDENAVFPDTFTSNRLATADMAAVILPFFQRMFNAPITDVRDFVITNRFGQPPVPHNDPMKLAVTHSHKDSDRHDLMPVEIVKKNRC